MSINFIPNDPLAGAGAPPMRRIRPRRDRPRDRARFTLHDPAAEGLHEPGTPEFLYWQCREAALGAVAAWEGHAGPLASWQAGRSIDLWQNEVAQNGATRTLNAFYDRAGFHFYEYDDGMGKGTLSGQSTDVVAHEVGHGLLDAIRADLWNSTYLEVAALHEAFGDCVALLTALADARTRIALAAKLGRPNFVETTAEDLSDSIRRILPQHNAADPRHAFNTLKWQLPSSLPSDGGPGVLINESHSFARIFTGCFWDLLRNLLGTGATSARLQIATRTAARLLVAGARDAPETPRFLQSVGRAMTLADDQLNGGANRQAIHDAFAGHGTSLGTNAMLAPTAALEGTEPALAAARPVVSKRTLSDVAGRLGATARLAVRPRPIAGGRVMEAVHQREVALEALHPKLKGVVAFAPESVLIGGSGGRAALLGGLPDRAATVSEVESYVASLVDHHRIQFEKGEVLRVRGEKLPRWHSHGVRKVGAKRVLVRVRFACGL
jgi:hypothetical protein